MLNAGQQTKPLSAFETLQPQQIFKTATSYPDFFNTHLVDPLRVIKLFKDDPNGLERIFYYQYLLLCTEEETYPDIRIENMKIILNSPEFFFSFPSDCQKFPYTDDQFKRLGLQFLDLIKKEPKKLDEILKRFPIIDLVFTFLMRSLVIINMHAEECEQFVSKDQLLSVLGRIFDIEYESIDKCIKFVESDVFVYEESLFQVYMVYLRDETHAPPTLPVINQLQIPMTKKKSSKKERNQLYKSSTSNEHYDFVDYTGLQPTKSAFSANLFQSQNLSLKPFSKLFAHAHEHRMNDSFGKVEKDPQINIIEVKAKESDLKAPNQDKEVCMDIDLVMNDSSHKAMLGMAKPQSRKPSSDIQNDLSGFESGEDGPKFVAVFPTATTVENNVEPVQFQPQDSKVQDSMSSIDQKLKNTGSDIQKEAMDNSSRQFSFRNESFIAKPEPVAEIYQKETSNFQTPIKRGTQMQKISPFKEIQRAQLQYTVKKSIPTYSQSHYSQKYVEPTYKCPSNVPILRLNVTKEFTNSFIMKQMPEIYSEGVRRTRERARAFRKTMLQTM